MSTKPLRRGQKIIVKRNLGTQNGRAAAVYYYGRTLREVPLGSRGAIVNPCENHYKIDVGGLILCLQNQEFELDDTLEKEQRAKYDSLLEVVLSEDADVVEGDLTEVKERTSSLWSRIKGLFGYKSEVEDEVEERGKPFEPKFNVREEFAVWVREQFPEIDKYENNKRKYKALVERRKEVYKAVEAACNHGINTTKSCVASNFKNHLETLRECRDSDFGVYIGGLVSFVEKVSANLRDREDLHYGTKYEDGGNIR